MKHFWWSDEYSRLIADPFYFPNEPNRIALLESGELVVYHFLSHSKDSPVKWKDAEYLGAGEVYSIDGVVQFEQGAAR